MDSKTHPYSILYIEDEKEIRENYVTYLKRDYAEVCEAQNAEIALQIYKEKIPDIMIVDINLPKMTGLDFIKIIRETNLNVKIIVLTAHSNVSYLLEASELKLTKYLVKPVSRSDLKNALELAMDEYVKFDVKPNKIVDLKEGFQWNFDKKELLFNSNVISLTNKEKIVISLLLSHPNKVFTYDDIIIEVWDSFEDNKIDALKTIVKNIRKKLPKETIKNVFGIGYKFIT